MSNFAAEHASDEARSQMHGRGDRAASNDHRDCNSEHRSVAGSQTADPSTHGELHTAEWCLSILFCGGARPLQPLRPGARSRHLLGIYVVGAAVMAVAGDVGAARSPGAGRSLVRKVDRPDWPDLIAYGRRARVPKVRGKEPGPTAFSAASSRSSSPYCRRPVARIDHVRTALASGAWNNLRARRPETLGS